MTARTYSSTNSPRNIVADCPHFVTVTASFGEDAAFVELAGVTVLTGLFPPGGAVAVFVEVAGVTVLTGFFGGGADPDVFVEFAGVTALTGFFGEDTAGDVCVELAFVEFAFVFLPPPAFVEFAFFLPPPCRPATISVALRLASLSSDGSTPPFSLAAAALIAFITICWATP